MQDYFKLAKAVLDEFTVQGGLFPDKIREATEQMERTDPSVTYAFDIKGCSFLSTIYHGYKKGKPTIVAQAEISFARLTKDDNYANILEKCLELNVQLGNIRIFLCGDLLLIGFLMAIDSSQAVQTFHHELQRLPYAANDVVKEIEDTMSLFSSQNKVATS